MKMILLMYLEDDDETVEELLEGHGVIAYSRMKLEGHGRGLPSAWTGEVAPYHSRMVFTLLPEDRARELMDAVQACTGCQDPRHPVHAVQLSVDRAVDSGGASA